MTDHPRFAKVKGNPDTIYCNFHGAPAVRIVFACADALLAGACLCLSVRLRIAAYRAKNGDFKVGLGVIAALAAAIIELDSHPSDGRLIWNATTSIGLFTEPALMPWRDST